MTLRLVVDCSVTMAWCFADEANDYSNGVLEALRAGEAVVPALWPLEVANVLAIAERRKRIHAADAAKFVEALGALRIAVEPISFERATGVVLGLAREHALTAYDAAYLDLAMRTGYPLATGDEDLRRAGERAGVPRFLPT